MNPQLLILLKQIRDQLIVLKNRLLQYVEEAYDSTMATQKQLYSQVFNWLAVRVPAFTIPIYKPRPGLKKAYLYCLGWLLCYRL